MCSSSPKAPAAPPPPPPPPQELKLPDASDLQKRNKMRQAGIAGGTQLTGAMGLAGTPATGANTLLGG